MTLPLIHSDRVPVFLSLSSHCAFGTLTDLVNLVPQRRRGRRRRRPLAPPPGPQLNLLLPHPPHRLAMLPIPPETRQISQQTLKGIDNTISKTLSPSDKLGRVGNCGQWFNWQFLNPTYITTVTECEG